MSSEGSRLFRRFDYLRTVDSTNSYLKSRSDGRGGRALLAWEQTAGRGRHDRTWHSPAGEGLYMSYLIYPKWPVSRLPFLNILPSLAVVEMVRPLVEKDSKVALKSPNDVLISGRKVCGILSESKCREARIEWAVVGIGINLYQTEFPGHLKEKATSLRLCGGEVEDPLEFFHALTRKFEQFYQAVMQNQWVLLEERYGREVLPPPVEP